MNYQENDIVTLVLLNGAEVIGRYKGKSEGTVTIYKPRMVSPQESATGVTIGFVPGISMTGEQPNGDFVFSTSAILYILRTNDQIASGWQKTTSGLVT